MALPVDTNAAPIRSKATTLHAPPPFHVQLPDVSPPRNPRPAAAPVPGSGLQSDNRAAANDPVDRARARLRKKRYDDGQQHVTGILDRLRDRRRKLFGRLWMASVLITALSIVVLAVELIQGLNFTEATAETIPSTSDAEATRPIVRKPASRSQRPIIPVEARAALNEQPAATGGESPVRSALYTTEGNRRPKGVWLDGTISDNDDSEEATR